MATSASTPQSTTEVQKNLEQKNGQYAQSFGSGSLAAPPKKKYLIVTCMDARIEVMPAFGVDLGDAHIVRNAGGSAREALRSIVISQQFLGTNEVLIIKHTRCGMETFTDPDADKKVEESLGKRAVETLGGKEWHSFGKVGLAQAVKDDVEYLTNSGCLVDGATVSGWTYDVESGTVSRVA